MIRALFSIRRVDPERWLRNGLIWATLTIVLTTLLQGAGSHHFNTREFFVRVMLTYAFAPVFGLGVRYAERRKSGHAR